MLLEILFILLKNLCSFFLCASVPLAQRVVPIT
jgi:hypothetical protein